MDITAYPWYQEFIDSTDPKKFESMYEAARLYFATNQDYDNNNLTPEQQTEILACYAQVNLLGVAFAVEYKAQREDFDATRLEEYIAMIKLHDDEVVAFHKEKDALSIETFGVSIPFNPLHI